MLQDKMQAQKTPLKKLSEAEALLLRLAAQQVRLVLRICRSEGVSGKDAAGAAETARLLASAQRLLSTMLGSVPKEGKRLPFWTRRPHLVADVLRLMLEAVYAAPTGEYAAAAAGDVTRLWEAYALGGTRMTAQSAGATGQMSYQAKIQRSTRGTVILLLAHALEQQRRWHGVDAATTRCLQRLSPAERKEARSGEVAHWKEVVGILQAGMNPLLTSLEGSDYLKQSLYTGLREPLNTMFKELHENFQERGRYRGEA
uniref:Uncharacterized protein n=1 Tax=Alexandrium catenella TaxID=2925 RepID=A0A7S1RK87_ALECA